MQIHDMRLLAVFGILVFVTSCAPVRETPSPVATAAKPSVSVTPPPPAVPLDHSPIEPARAKSTSIAGIDFEGVSFDSRSHRLAVLDQPEGPGSKYADAASAAISKNGLAAVNAGFFTPEGDPLGLVVTAGNRAGNWNSASSLGSAIWHENPSGSSAITRREKLGKQGTLAMREAIQAGPLLVENRKAVSGLERSKPSVRIVLLWDGGSRWWMGRASACTLSELADAIVSGNPAGWSAKHAINLDGGRSADLWISENIPGGPLTRRPPWNRPVRNFLVLVRR